jgi:large subunit ribosomal protein L30
MKKIKITQIKSPIGREKSQKLTLISLGLNKLNKEKIVTENPAMNGMIEKVKHLLKVEKV